MRGKLISKEKLTDDQINAEARRLLADDNREGLHALAQAHIADPFVRKRFFRYGWMGHGGDGKHDLANDLRSVVLVAMAEGIKRWLAGKADPATFFKDVHRAIDSARRSHVRNGGLRERLRNDPAAAVPEDEKLARTTRLEMRASAHERDAREDSKQAAATARKVERLEDMHVNGAAQMNLADSEGVPLSASEGAIPGMTAISRNMDRAAQGAASAAWSRTVMYDRDAWIEFKAQHPDKAKQLQMIMDRGRAKAAAESLVVRAVAIGWRSYFNRIGPGREMQEERARGYLREWQDFKRAYREAHPFSYFEEVTRGDPRFDEESEPVDVPLPLDVYGPIRRPDGIEVARAVPLDDWELAGRPIGGGDIRSSNPWGRPLFCVAPFPEATARHWDTFTETWVGGTDKSILRARAVWRENVQRYKPRSLLDTVRP